MATGTKPRADWATHRLLQLGVIVVLVCLFGLSVVRVTSSGAFESRSRASRITVGMARAEVRHIMADLPEDTFIHKYSIGDIWIIGGYQLNVLYEDLDDAESEPDIRDQRVVRSMLVAPGDERTVLDRVLEFMGYPKAIVLP